MNRHTGACPSPADLELFLENNSPGKSTHNFADIFLAAHASIKCMSGFSLWMENIVYLYYSMSSVTPMGILAVSYVVLKI